MASAADPKDLVLPASYPDDKGDMLEQVQTAEKGTTELQYNEQTHRGFKPRHAQMIAIGAQVLRVGGPGFLLLSYGVLGIFVYGIMTGIAEVATYLPVPGGTMAYYGNKYVSSSLGFAMGYLYWYSLGILVPYEFVAVTLLIDYWGSPVSPAVWITILLVLLVLLNFLPVQFFGEIEFWSAGMKIILIIGLTILSYWQDPGAVNEHIEEGDLGRFIALLQSFVLASFAFVLAPEQLIVTAGEMQSPRYNLPRAARRYFWRLFILYIPMVIAIGVVCPSNDPRLEGSGAASSPFVIAITNAGIPVLDSIVNALIILSATTAGNAFLYSSSRNLYSLAISGNAPSIFKRCNSYGLPYYAVAASASFSPLAYLSLSSTSLTVFNWLINITNTSGFISWICCGVIYWRYRAAISHHGLQSPYRSRFQPWSMYVGAGGAVVLLLINGFEVFLGTWSTSSFLTAYIGIPAFLVLYLGHRVRSKGEDWIKKSAEVDMFEGWREVLEAETAKPNRGKVAKRLMALIE